MLKSYISVTFQMEVWCFLTRSILLALFSSLAHARLMQSITIDQFLSHATRLSPLTYSYPLCPISLVGSQRSPFPTPSWIELSHPSLIFTFFCASHLFPTMLLSFLVELSRSERKKTPHCSCCGHWLMKGGCDSAKKPLKIGEDREDEIPI